MVFAGTQRLNDLAHLEIGGCDAVALAERFGTPLYVLDEALIRQRCRDYLREFGAHWPKVLIVFASKALMATALCRLAEQEGLGVDVSTMGELYTALKADFPAERLVVHGNNKSDEEIEAALRCGAGRLVIDSLAEIERVQECGARLGRTAPVLLRMTPGVDAHTNDKVRTGHFDTKFGIPPSQAVEAVQRARAATAIRLRGYHCHIGSQLFLLDHFRVAVEAMTEIAAEVRDATNYAPEELNLGGGLGVRYRWSDQPPTIADLAEVVCSGLAAGCRRHGLPEPVLALEPGRSIVGDAGLTLYRVGVVKAIPGVRTYLAVDGGMSDNPRPALYGAKYEVIIANKALQEATWTVTVAGKHCESDTLVEDVEVPPVEPGDILAMPSTGAYTYSMASNYNRLPKAAVVLVADGTADLIVRRQTLDEVIAQDIMPERLNPRS